MVCCIKAKKPERKMPQRGARGAACALLVARCTAFTIFSRPPRSVTCRFVLERATEQPRQKIVRKSTQTTWDELVGEREMVQDLLGS